MLDWFERLMARPPRSGVQGSVCRGGGSEGPVPGQAQFLALAIEMAERLWHLFERLQDGMQMVSDIQKAPLIAAEHSNISVQAGLSLHARHRWRCEGGGRIQSSAFINQLMIQCLRALIKFS